jgi:hypothetical protein
MMLANGYDNGYGNGTGSGHKSVKEQPRCTRLWLDGNPLSVAAQQTMMRQLCFTQH